MRRKDKEITERSEIEAVIRKAVVCRIGLSDANKPYVVPVCFGYEDNKIYLHSSPEGKKIDILRKNPLVCFEFDVDAETVEADPACKWSMRYRSVVGFGKAAFVEADEEKQKALAIIMGHYTDQAFQFTEKAIKHTAVIKIDIEKMTGKQSGI